MTYSIIAVDRATGEVGAAVASSVLSIGRGVPWVRAGVGAVATQSFTWRRYGPRGLDRLQAGATPEQALEALLAEDDDRATRQLGIVSLDGATAGWTGDGCVPAVGMRSGDGWRVQGNMLVSERVVEAMAAAYEAATGPLAERLVATLAAAEPAGGDLRGRQSAALLVAAGPRTDDPEQAVTVNLRVDDSADPHGELARLVRVQIALDTLAVLPPTAPVAALVGAHEAVAEVSPERLAVVHRAVAAALDGRGTEADRLWAGLAERQLWRGYVETMYRAGRLPGGGALLERIG